MSAREQILSRFSGTGDAVPAWLPDLTLWHEWHRTRNTLPAEWAGYSLPEVARALGAPVWLPVRPWRLELPGVEVRTEERDGERAVTYETPSGSLVARWVLGPDGDWWQTEFPIKSGEDLAAARQVVDAYTYVPDPAEWVRLDAAVGDAGVVALELPRRPYSEMLFVLLGCADGLMLLLGEERPAILEMIAVLEGKVQELVRAVATLPGSLAYSPDNLDAQFISPTAFRDHLAASYGETATALRAAGKHLVVHANGSIRRLLGLLAGAGVAGVEGVAGPPLGDSTLDEAREVAGPDLTLWGGIPQDFLLDVHGPAALATAVEAAAAVARRDRRSIVGVADRVPAGASAEGLRALARLIEATR